MDKQPDLISRMQDEADLCRNEGASDIAALLDEATEALRVERVVLAELTLKTGKLIEHLQNTGRLKPCFYMQALDDARNALDSTTKRRRSHVCPVCAASMIESDEALMRQALEALQFSSEYLDELGAKLFPSTKKAKPGSTAWHVQKAMAALRGRLDAAQRRS